MNPHQSNYIAPIPDQTKQFIDSITEVKNSADLWSTSKESDLEINLLDICKRFWNQHNVKVAGDFESSFRNGVHASHDSRLNDNPGYALLRGYIELLKQLFRSSDKSIQDIKYLLDVLEKVNDNISHIISKDKTKIDNQYMLASMHGFITGVITSKVRIVNESTNE